MEKALKSPQTKKKLEFEKDHFTFGWKSSRMFPRTWKRKKTQANRDFRRKSDELFAQAKPAMSAEAVEAIAGDITTAHLAKSVTRKRLHKSGTVTVGEKVKLKLERRSEAAGRRVKNHEKYDLLAAEAVGTLTSLGGDPLVEFVRRTAIFNAGGDPIEWERVMRSRKPIDRALRFVHLVLESEGPEREAICRNEELLKVYRAWAQKANRILKKDRLAIKRKLEQKQSTERRVKALRRQAESTPSAAERDAGPSKR
jgi:hypothetical protein